MSYRACPCCGCSKIKIIEDGSYAQCAGCEVEAHIAFWQRFDPDYDELSNTIDRLGDLLTNTANALKGDPGELRLHSWHDLPDKAGELTALVMRAVAMLEQSGVESVEKSDNPLESWLFDAEMALILHAV